MIVFITIPWFLPAYRAGGPIQSVANLIENFAEDVEYRVFCGDEDINGEPLTGVAKNEWTDYNSYTKVWYADKDNVSDVICKEIQHIKPEALYIIGLFSWHFNIVPMLFCKADKKIISVRGMLHPGALSQKKVKKRLFLTALKTVRVTAKNIFHATDEMEEQYIKKEFGLNTKTVVAGNFAKKMVDQWPLQKTAGYLIMVTIALISPMKNHLMVLESLKECRENIQYNIYGPIKDEVYWQKCKDIIAELPNNIIVQYRGEITPDFVADVLSHQHIFIMPSKSENFGHAIAEALSSGKPVITSNNTPWNNLELNDAGINTETDFKSISKAISFFAKLNQSEYNEFVKGSRLYSIKNNKKADNMKAYKKLFFGEI